jgi:predicted HD superfamily hydrolase involved in NAD metabolism
MDFEKIRADLAKVLSEKRYLHTLGVEEVGVRLAERWGENPDEMRIAALLHDCAKGMRINEQFEFCRQNGIPISREDTLSPGVIHARIGAFLAHWKYHVKEREILDAIFFHPTGKDNMTRLQKLLFIADYIDPNRDLHVTGDLTELAFDDMETAVLEIVIAKNEYLIENRMILHPDSIKLYNWQIIYIEQRK